MKGRFLKFFLFFFIFCIGLLIFFGFFINSAFIKIKLHTYLEQEFAKNNIKANIEKIYISSFYYINADISNIVYTNDSNIKIDKINFQLALFNLLKKEICFNKLNITNIYISKFETKDNNSSFSLKAKKINIKNLNFIFNNEEVSIDLEGSFKINKKNDLDLDFYIKREKFFREEQFVNLVIKKQNNNIFSNIFLDIKDNKFFYPFLDINIPISIKGNIRSEGSLTDYITLINYFLYSKKAGGNNDTIINNNINVFVSYQNNIVLKDINLISKIDIEPSQGNVIFDYSFKNNYFESKGICGLKKFAFDYFSFNFKSIDLESLDKKFTGILNIHTKIEKDSDNFIFNNFLAIENFSVLNTKIDEFKGFFNLTVDPLKNIKASPHISFDINSIPFSLQGNLHGNILTKIINLEDLKIITPFSSSNGNLSFIKDYVDGEIDFDIQNLNDIEPLFNILKFDGKVFSKLRFLKKDSQQTIRFVSDIFDLQIFDYYVDKLKIDYELMDVFKNNYFDMNVLVENFNYNQMTVEKCCFNTNNYYENKPFFISCKGKWGKEVFELDSQGFYNINDDEFLLNIQDIKGFLFSQSFGITSPIQLEWGTQFFLLKNLDIDCANSILNADINLMKNKSSIKLYMNHFPIDFLSFNPINLNIDGFLTTDIFITQNKDQVDGNINIKLDEINITSLKDKKKIALNGFIQGLLKDNDLKSKVQILTKHTQFIDADLILPIDINLFPFRCKANPKKEFFTEVIFDGDIGNVINFFNIGAHKLEGDVTCNIKASNTLYDPHIKGFFKLNNGIYENYYTGAFFKDVIMDLDANDNKKININLIKGKDLNEGNFSAKGFVDFEYGELLQFNLCASLEHLTLINLDWLLLKSKGDIEINGNRKGACIKGDVDVEKAQISIPEKLPHPILELPIKMINVNKSNNSDVLLYNPKKFYDLNLDLNINTKENIYVQGRGLDSEWEGNFELKGNAFNPFIYGKLELVKGVFIFAGREFVLNKGEVSFLGKNNEDNLPNIYVEAKTNQQGTTIIATLKGPINKPSLAFTSNPPLPESAVMSLLLFGQDISDLSNTQITQLTRAMSAFSTNSSVLESTRKVIGIDRLAIVPSSSDQQDKMALQVGKYITKGVLVSFSQGTEQGTSNVMIELDLHHGFIFQAETQQQGEQAKFTIKWNYNY